MAVAAATDPSAASLSSSSPPQLKPLTLLELATVGIWTGGIHITVILLLVAVSFLPRPWAVLLLLILLTLALIPLYRDSWFARAVSRLVCMAALKYFPVTLVKEEGCDLKTPCVFGVEPHSILPLGVIALSSEADTAPLPNCHCGATDAVFSLPIVRHLWSWLGLVPASKQSLKSMLARGVPVGVIPGGVQECLYMEHGAETIFLRKRKGFVRLALEEKVPLVPVFMFGQSFLYHWWRPGGGMYNALARRLGFAPLLFWGRWGTSLPMRTPILVVVGKPIQPPPISGDDITQQVEALHKTFIGEMERIFVKYRKLAGYENIMLRIL